MNVYVNVFETQLTNTNHIGYEQFWNYLIQHSGVEFTFDRLKRLLYVHEFDSYYGGMLITIKEEKTFCALKQDSGELSLAVETLEGNDKFMDFNFFIFNKNIIDDNKTRGVYQNYRSSCSLIRFTSLLENRFNQFLESERELLAATLQQQRHYANSTARTRACEAKRGKFVVRPLIDRKSFLELMQELREIRSFSYEYSVWNDNEPLFTPERDIVKSKIEEVKFHRCDIQRIIGVISTGLTRNLFSRGTLVGNNADGREVTLKLDSNRYDFGIEDFDNVTEKLDFGNLNNFNQCVIFHDLKTITQNHADIFGG